MGDCLEEEEVVKCTRVCAFFCFCVCVFVACVCCVFVDSVFALCVVCAYRMDV